MIGTDADYELKKDLESLKNNLDNSFQYEKIDDFPEKWKKIYNMAFGGLKTIFTLDSISASMKDNDMNNISFYGQKIHSILNK